MTNEILSVKIVCTFVKGCNNLRYHSDLKHVLCAMIVINSLFSMCDIYERIGTEHISRKKSFVVTW